VKRTVIAAIAAASALAGGAAGVVLLSPTLANAGGGAAQAPAAYPSGGPGGNGPGGPGRGRGDGGPGRHELVSDESVVAKAIGISESDLAAAVAKGQTWAQVAQAHGVSVQKVIDALVADGKTELADEVKSGRLTQAQADAMQAGLVQRVTDQVNGMHPGGGPGRPNDNDADDSPPGAPANPAPASPAPSSS
jgi:hypothetical protein